MRRTLFILMTAVLCGGAASHSDWKAFNGKTEGSIPVYTFYDASRIRRQTGNHVEVWTKSLDAREIRKSASGEVIRTAGDRILAGYAPPIAKILDLNGVELLNAVVAEMVSNEAAINPETQILWEIDCDGRVTRALATLLKGPGSTQAPSPWIHMPPQSMGDNLMTLVCS